MSDFHTTVGIIHSGICPLCDSELGTRVVPQEVELTLEKRPIRFERNWCNRCSVGWRIQGLHDPVGDDEGVIGMGPQIITTRKLTPDEMRKMYDRGTT